MATIEPYEIPLLKRYHLNQEAVCLYRMRLRGEPPLPWDELRDAQRKLNSLFRRINALKGQVAEIRHALDKYRVSIQSDRICWPEQDADESLRWILEAEQWGQGYSLPDNPAGAVYTERPERGDALRAWNRFVVAFQAAPVRMMRRKGYRPLRGPWVPPGYVAEFRDSCGDLFTIDEVDIIEPKLAAAVAK